MFSQILSVCTFQVLWVDHCSIHLCMFCPFCRHLWIFA